jgi:hypothetical protein
MLAASDAFKASLRTSHAVAIECELLQPGAEPITLPVESGAVEMDRTARTRRTASISVPMTVDVDVRSLPFGSYVRVKRGIRYASGERELVVLGYLRVESVGWQTHEDTATLELADRMVQVSDEVLLAPVSAAGLKPTAAAIAMVTEVFGGAITYTSTIDPASEPTLVDVVYSGNRADAVADLAQAVGGAAGFDMDGNFRIEPLPTLAAEPVWTIDAGAEGVMVSAGESLDRTTVFNGVLVQGQPSSDGPPVAALVVDDNPESRTYWGGPFGKVARLETSTAVQTEAQAEATASALLLNQLGLGRQVSVASVPNPLLVAGDTVELVFPDGRSELHLIQSHRTPLNATEPSTLVSRSVWQAVSTLREPLLRSYFDREAWQALSDARPWVEVAA